jgi:hypothetical protein
MTRAGAPPVRSARGAPSAANSTGSTLIATSPPSFVSVARYTHATGADGGGDAVMGEWLADHSRLSQRRKSRSTTSISSASHSPISAVIEARGTLTALSIMT